MIEARGIVKRYGDHTAVDGVSFTVEKGSAFGLLGPNGAGKTTTLHMLIGVLAPDAGEVVIGGVGPPSDPALRARVGVAPQSLAIYDEMSAEENLRFVGKLYRLSAARLAERVEWCLEFSGLTERRKDRAKTFSGGMQRRLNLACALVHEPDVLLCDEPTVGVDPQSRNHIFGSIEKLCAAGTTLIYTTHYMEEAQRLCDRVAIMDHGRILALDTVSALIDAHGGESIVEAEFAPGQGRDTGAAAGDWEGDVLRMSTPYPFEAVAKLSSGEATIERLRIDRPDLERVFLELTGRSLRD